MILYGHERLHIAATDRCRSVMQAGATAVVPETLEPSLQLAAAVLSQLNLPSDEVAQAIQGFRKNHVAELQASLSRGSAAIDL